MTDVKRVADEADMIVNGYAFTQNNDREIRIIQGFYNNQV